VSACTEFEPLVSLHATGALDAEDVRRLEQHLIGCERCRANLVDTQAAFDLARLPPVSQVERRAFATLPSTALTELRRERVGTPIWRAFAAGFAAAAAIAVMIAAPTQVPPPFRAPGAITEHAAWQEPDPDELLELVGASDEVVEEPVVLARAEQLADTAYGRVFAEQ
jgi:anti-sigma factor RsiW